MLKTRSDVIAAGFVIMSALTALYQIRASLQVPLVRRLVQLHLLQARLPVQHLSYLPLVQQPEPLCH